MPNTPHPPQQGFAMLPLYYRYIWEAIKLGNIDSNGTIFEDTAIICDIFEGNGSKIRKVSRSGPEESNETTLRH